MKTKARTHGFTLLELLAASVITLVLTGVMLTVLVGTLELWRRAQDRFTTASQAQLVFDYLQRDLSGALFRPDGQTWLAAELFDASVSAHGWLVAALMKPALIDVLPTANLRPQLAAARFGRSGTWIRFFTSDAPTTGDRTLPVLVSYQLGRRPLNDNDLSTARYSLFRSVVDSAGTLATAYSVNGYTSRLLTPDLADVLATNVVDFGVWLHRRESDGGLTRIYPVSNSNAGHAADSRASAPAVVDVLVRILTEEGATMIGALEQGITTSPPGTADDVWWWDVAQRHSHVYVRRIMIQRVDARR